MMPTFRAECRGCLWRGTLEGSPYTSSLGEDILCPLGLPKAQGETPPTLDLAGRPSLVS